MLWYKAWLETRSRFLIALVGCTALSSMWMVEFGRQVTSYRGLPGLFNLLHSIQDILTAAWILSIVLLMMGGLVQEQAVGAASFTLALPVSRSRLMWVRICTGLVQAFFLAVTPWFGMLFASGAAGKAYPISQVVLHVFYLLGGGVVSLAIAVLISSIVEGQYTAPVVSIGLLALLMNAVKAKSLLAFSPWTFMTGSQYFETRTGLLDGTFHFVHAAGFIATSALLLMFSVKVIQRRDF
jgi:ABC-type transport system involved in multi-copper enzyme maturation permease subunit